LDAASVEGVFRRHAAILHESFTPDGQRHIALDGKALRLSFDNFCDRKAAHILSAFASDPALVLDISSATRSPTKSRRSKLLRQLGLEQAVLTVDAMHCQPLRRPHQLAPC
jgi:hypothetical protein